MKNTFILFTAILLAAVADGERTYTLLDGNDWTLDNIPVLVPHCWNKIDGADGNPALADDTKIYSAVPATSYLRARRIYARPLPAARPGRRYFIRCEGASQKATVVVNGVVIGSHKGSFTAFCFEATAAMKPSGNRLEIEVSNEYDPTIPPASGGFNIHGGLYRSVWFIETDPVCIDPTRDGGPGVRVFPSMDGSVHVEADVSGADDAVVDWEPKKVAAPRLWSPETPVVYTVKVTVRKGEWSDTVEQPFGFRTAEIRKDGFYLNGERARTPPRALPRQTNFRGNLSTARRFSVWISRSGFSARTARSTLRFSKTTDFISTRADMVFGPRRHCRYSRNCSRRLPRRFCRRSLLQKQHVDKKLKGDTQP